MCGSTGILHLFSSHSGTEQRSQLFSAQRRRALSLEPSLVFRHSIPGFLACASSRVPRTQEELSGTNWRSNLRIASGSCFPAAPVRVYVLSNPWGPSTRISQFSLSAIRRWSLASPLVYRPMHVRCWPRFPSTAEHLRGSAVLRLLPSRCNFIEELAPFSGANW
jgi:hypothetical protein